VEKEDRIALQDLVKSEPSRPTREQAAHWLDVYARLIEMIERHLEEHRQFLATVPEAVQRYLNEANVQVLREELAAFKDPRAHWQRYRRD
jgi:hypothetical protein